jgi:hypothetical protein
VTDDAIIPLLLEIIDRAYDRTSWHGPNLRGSIRGVTAAQAMWRPAKGRHNIAEQVLHAAYWKYAVRRRIRGDKRGSFPIKGSNWFAVPARLSDSEWRGHGDLLESEHHALRETVAGFDPARLGDRLPGGGGKTTPRLTILGIAAHDVYHAGQIQLLKRLQAQD